MWTAVVLVPGVLFVAWVMLRKKTVVQEGDVQAEQAAGERLRELVDLNEGSSQNEAAATDAGTTLLSCAELIGEEEYWNFGAFWTTGMKNSPRPPTNRMLDARKFVSILRSRPLAESAIYRHGEARYLVSRFSLSDSGILRLLTRDRFVDEKLQAVNVRSEIWTDLESGFPSKAIFVLNLPDGELELVQTFVDFNVTLSIRAPENALRPTDKNQGQ